VSRVFAGEGESFESLLRRFSKKVQQDGVLAEIRRRGSYEKPSVKRKKKEATKKRKSARSSRGRPTSRLTSRPT
jgi:small subunit ribosomal protein S21